MFPTNTQELFEHYVYDEISLISEYSGDIVGELKELKTWTEGYASQNGLSLSNVRIKLDQAIVDYEI